jgi:putative endonuclease
VVRRPGLPVGGAQLALRVRRARPGELVFCEVKARSSSRFGIPAEAVTAAKQRRLRTLAASFLAAHGDAPGLPGRGAALRFDVASVHGGRVDVIESAF